MGAKMVEEKRKKTGMEILPSLMDALKRRALDQQVPLWRVVQDALEAYLEVEPEASMIPRALWKYPQKFKEVLSSGNGLAIDAVTRNVDVFLEYVQLARQAHKGR